MGTLNVNTLKSETLTGKSVASSIAVTAEGGSITTNLQQGLVKCWCYWEDTDTVRDSFNSSGLTDNGTGDATYSYTNNMANDDYAFAMSGSNTTTGQPISTGDSGHQTVVAVGSLKFSFVGTSSKDVTDCNIGNAMIMGDLA